MSGFVYFIRPKGTEGPTKIGHSLEPSQRLVELERFSPFRLEVAAMIPGDNKLERRIQNSFADFHSHGEWFAINPRLTKSIADLQAGVPFEQAIDLTKRGSPLGNTIRETMLRNGNDYYRGGGKKRAANTNFRAVIVAGTVR